MTRRRVLMTVDAVGGVWQYATELSAALVPLGYDAVLALLGPAASAGQRRQVAAIPGLRVIETGLALDWMSADAEAVAHTATAIAALARSLDVDLVQLNQPGLAVADFAMPVVVVAHSCVGTWWQAAGSGPEPASFAWQTDLMHRGLRRAARVVCPSRAFAAAIAARYDLPVLPATVYNGRTPSAPLSPVVQHDGAFTAGRLWDAGKNAATLDRAAAMMAAPFTAAGPLAGPNGEVARFAHLRTPGMVDDAAIQTMLAARPVFVSAARYEPFGLAVLEAAQAGCSLVLADIATLRELWNDAAVFVDPGDAAGFAEAIETMIANPELRRAGGDAARRHAEQYSSTRMANGMDAIYAGVGPAARKVAA